MLARQQKRELAIFALAITGGDGNRVTTYDRLRAMSAEERRRVRSAIVFLDEALDQVTLDLHLARGKSKSKGGRNHNEDR